MAARKKVVAYVALGSNLGDRIKALRAAVAHLQAHPSVAVVRASPVYEAKAHTLTPHDVQSPYLNAVIELTTRLSPEDLLAFCHEIERHEGRERRQKWAPRTLDLDLYDGRPNDHSRVGAWLST